MTGHYILFDSLNDDFPIYEELVYCSFNHAYLHISMFVWPQLLLIYLYYISQCLFICQIQTIRLEFYSSQKWGWSDVIMFMLPILRMYIATRNKKTRFWSEEGKMFVIYLPELMEIVRSTKKVTFQSSGILIKNKTIFNSYSMHIFSSKSYLIRTSASSTFWWSNRPPKIHINFNGVW